MTTASIWMTSRRRASRELGTDAMKARVLIAGAGDIGLRLGQRLVQAGHEVYALRRNTSGLVPELQPIAADLSDPATLARVPSDLTHIAYTAAADESTEAAYQRAYVTGLANVLSLPAVGSTGFSRLVFISSTAVYAQTDGSWVDEQSETAPRHFAGQKTLQAEQLLMGSTISACALRCGGIYGPGRTRLIDQVRAGQASYDPVATQYTNRIHTDDVVGALYWLLFSEQAPPIVNGVDEEPAPRAEVLRWLAARLGAPPPTPQIPVSTTRRSSPGSKRVSGDLLRSLGYGFVYPSYREGYAMLLSGQSHSD